MNPNNPQEALISKTPPRTPPSTEDSPSNRFYLNKGKNTEKTFEINNDSFSFNNNQKNIFNKIENLSCVKKETPKFSAMSNQKSAPTENLMANFAAIKNQIRYKENMKKVLNNQKQIGGNFGSGNDRRKILESLLNNQLGVSKMPQCVTRQSSKTRSGMVSHKQRLQSMKIRKTPKVLSQKNLELFNTNYLLHQYNLKSSKKIISKELSYTSKPSLNSHLPESIFQQDIFKLKSSKLKSTSKLNNIIYAPNEIKAKELSEDFKNDFIKGLKIPYTNYNDGRMESSQKFSLKDTVRSKGNGKGKGKVSMRYQSASKMGNEEYGFDRDDECSSSRSKQMKESKLSQREIVKMRYLKKVGSSNRKRPLVPNLDYF